MDCRTVHRDRATLRWVARYFARPHPSLDSETPLHQRSIFFTRLRFTVITPRGKCEEYNAHKKYFRSDGLGYLF
jgi:hypothetical protein